MSKIKQVQVQSSQLSSSQSLIPIDPSVKYHPYLDEVEMGAVFHKIDGMVDDSEEDWKFTRFLIPFTLFSWIAACLGIFLIFFGGAYTIAFSSVKRKFWLEMVGFVLCLPLVLWFLYMFCVSAEERKRRRRIFAKRKVRLEVYVKNPEILKQEAQQKIEERVQAEIKQREEVEKAKQLEKKLNPLKYPNKNVVTRKKLPE
jgi:hypothetical protein